MTAAKTKPANLEIKEDSKNTERRILEIAPEKVEKDHIMSITHFIKVQEKGYGRPYANEHTLKVNDLDGGPEGFGITGSSLIKRCMSADQFSETVTVSRTRLCEILVSSYNRPFTVNFDKQADKKTGEIENRTLRGRFLNFDTMFGRSNVEDLDKPLKGRFRQVDHRTLHWMIVDGIKYIAEK